MAAQEDMKVDVEVTTKTQSTKAGVKTSEFWTTMIVQIIAMIVTAVGLYRGSDGLAGVGAILMGLAQGSYNVGRAKEKASAAQALSTVLNGKGGE